MHCAVACRTGTKIVLNLNIKWEQSGKPSQAKFAYKCPPCRFEAIDSSTSEISVGKRYEPLLFFEHSFLTAILQSCSMNTKCTLNTVVSAS